MIISELHIKASEATCRIGVSLVAVQRIFTMLLLVVFVVVVVVVVVVAAAAAATATATATLLL